MCLHALPGITQYFPCNDWLDPSDPMSLNKTLLPRDADGNIGELLQYEVGCTYTYTHIPHNTPRSPTHTHTHAWLRLRALFAGPPSRKALCSTMESPRSSTANPCVHECDAPPLLPPAPGHDLHL